MIPQESILVILVRLIDRIPVPQPPKAGRGHPLAKLQLTFIGELLLPLWLLMKGVNIELWEKRALQAA